MDTGRERDPSCLGDDKLTPEAFLESKRQIERDLTESLIDTDQATAALETLAQENPAMLAAWEADIQRQMN